jgi:hypothetical protein
MATSRKFAIVASLIASGAFVGGAPRVVEADDFLLAGGARVTGEFLNADQSPRTTYEVKLSVGGTVTFPKEQVQEVVRSVPAAVEYETIRHQYPDTLDGQWALAEWCKDHKLLDQRKAHLQRVIEIEPNHMNARALLGYNRLQGQWRTTAEHQSALGKVEYKGQWRYPQEIEIIEAKEKQDKAERSWNPIIRRHREKIGGNASQAAKDAILAINDPTAVPALTKLMELEQDEAVRLLYVRALVKIGTGDSLLTVAKRSLTDPSEEIRTTAMELLAASKQRFFVDYYLQQLRSPDNLVVNRTAVALSYFKDPRSIAPLIDALVTKHTQQIQMGQPGAIAAGQGPGGVGLNMGANVRTETAMKQNEGVLASLLSVIDNKVNYRFDLEAWKHWYNGQKKQRLIDVRRS